MARRRITRRTRPTDTNILATISNSDDIAFEEFNEIFESMLERLVLTTSSGEYLATQNNEKLLLD